jgi:hypothetical protein
MDAKLTGGATGHLLDLPVRLTGRCMDPFSRLRSTHLRAALMTLQLEKSCLANEIASSDTTLGRKRQAIRHYSALMRELRMTVRELEVISRHDQGS